MNIENLTPEQIQLIMMSGEDDPAFGQADQKQKIADAMRQQASSRIEGRQIGNYYHPGSALEAGARIYRGRQAEEMAGQADTLRTGAQDRTVQGRQAYGQAMIDALRKRAAATQTPATSMTSPDDMDYGPHASQGSY